MTHRMCPITQRDGGLSFDCQMHADSAVMLNLFKSNLALHAGNLKLRDACKEMDDSCPADAVRPYKPYTSFVHV